MQINAKQFLQWGRETVRILCRLLFQVSRLDLIFRCDCSDVFHHMPHCVLDRFEFICPPESSIRASRAFCLFSYFVYVLFCSVAASDCAVAEFCQHYYSQAYFELSPVPYCTTPSSGNPCTMQQLLVSCVCHTNNGNTFAVISQGVCLSVRVCMCVRAAMCMSVVI